MKKIFNTLLCISLLSSSATQVFAQCAPWVSTNPSAPFNPHRPDVVQPQNPAPPYNQDNKYLNGFNWWNPIGYVLEPFMAFNPGQPYGFMSNIQHPSILPYYSYLRKDLGAEELTPQNGWELLLVNLGRYPDNQNQLTEMSFSAVPYIVLYNRYRGVIRVFVQHGRNEVPNSAIDGVQIYLEYEKPPNDNGNVSGLLRLGQGLDRTLDQNSVTRTLSVVAPTNGLYNFWMSGDIQIAYDPCVCWQPSILNMRFRFFSTTDLTLHGRAYTTQEALVDANGNAILDLPLLANFEMHNPDLEDAGNGFVIYKRMNDMVQTYIQRLEKHKADLEQVGRHNDIVNYNLFILKIFGTFLTLGKTAASTTTEMQSLTVIAPEIAFNYTNITETTKKKEDDKFGKFLKEVGKIMGANSEFLGFEDFTKKKEPNAPQLPTVAFTEMYLQGKLENEKQVNGPSFPTPGSFKNTDINTFAGLTSQYGYPVYNQALGTFALLERPKVKIADLSNDYATCIEHEELTTDTWNPNVPGGPTYNLKTLEERWANTIQIQLAEDLKYTFNPALDIKNHEIKAWFEMETHVVSDFPEEEYQWSPGNTGFFAQNWWSVPRNHPEMNINAFSTIVDMQYGYENIATPQFIVGNSWPPEISWLTHPIQSMPMPIDAFKTYPVSVSILNSHSVHVMSHLDEHQCEVYYGNDNYGNARMGRSYYSYMNGGYGSDKFGHKLEIDKLILKLEVSIEYNSNHSDGSPHATKEVHSFEIDLNDATSVDVVSNPVVEEEWMFSVNDKTKTKESIYLTGDIHFDGSPVDYFVYQPMLNKYLAYAWNDVVIADANLTIEPGSGITVEIIAGEIIEIYPNSEINPEIILRLSEEKFWDKESNPMPPVSPNYVEDFCKGLLQGLPNYAAHFTPRSSDEIAQDSVLLPEISDPIEFIVFPNPTTGASQAGLNLPELATVSISIVDITGKVQGRPVQNQVLPMGRNVLNLESEPLAPGVYFVQVVVNGEKLTQRLVKQ
jgi:hypothetical protein